MIKDKPQILNMLREELDRWEELLAGLSEEYITNPQLPSGLSIKDVITHLWAWQARSIARLEAAVEGREPRYPEWPAELDPETEDVDKLNDWIFETYRDKPWPEVYRNWKDGFQRFLELGQAIPEDDLFDTEKYDWLDGYSLADVLLGSYEHHHDEHLETLQAWLGDHGAMRSAAGPTDPEKNPP